MTCEILKVLRIVTGDENLTCDGDCTNSRCCTLSYLVQSPDADNNTNNQTEEGEKEMVVYLSCFEENNVNQV